MTAMKDNPEINQVPMYDFDGMIVVGDLAIKLCVQDDQNDNDLENHSSNPEEQLLTNPDD